MANKPWDTKYIAFQQAVKLTREEAGMTQRELATKMEKPQSFVSKYESGERKLDYIETSLICQICHCNLTEFENIYAKKLNSFRK